MLDKKIQWVEVARRASNQAVFITEATAEGVRQGFYKRFHKGEADLTTYRHFDGARSYSEHDLTRVTEELARKEAKHPGYLIKLAGRLIFFYEKQKKWVKSIALFDYRPLSNRELAKHFWTYYQRTFYLPISYIYIFVNRFLPDKIVAEVATRVPDVKRQTEILNILFSLDEITEIKAEKLNLYKIAKLFLQLKNLNHLRLKKAIHGHWRKYKHLNRYYYFNLDYTLAEIKRRVKAAAKKIQRGDSIEMPSTIVAKSVKIIRELRLSTATVKKIYAIKAMGKASNVFDENFVYCVSKIDAMFLEIARRLNLTRDELIMARGCEVVEALRGHCLDMLRQKLQNRLKNHALFLEKGKIFIYAGKQLELYHRKATRESGTCHGLKVLHGQGASPGTVRGVVKLVRDSQDISKMNQGDILVASATYPALVTIMERAAAIVTDEGGLLSHAAIVSRELGIPCVIGTKIATEVLKDGDEVEVDATHGVIRKLQL